MARATPTSASDAPRDAIALLKQDHRNVEALFSQFENAEDEQTQSSIAERICNMLTVHAQIEEELFYPAAKELLSEDEEQAELVAEANVEHASAKELIAKIEAMTPEDERFKATVKVLGEYVKHHVKEEENELFPAAKKAGMDVKELGGKLAERKFALMEEMGIEEEEPLPAAPARKRASAKSKGSRATARQARAGARSKSARSSANRSARH